ncbi:alpha/beta fold hydrolase [Streptomyces sp. NPDC039028]|uniref:Putative thioesterase TEII family n=1 Tax=Streptomyces bikiniensis TaxID=1896 RepID=Q5SFD4_STRBI|nr:putative thioesterase TEII family [Streptomyces bikiniensis]
MNEGPATTAPGSTNAGDLWLRRYRPVADPALRLVCLPHAGGSASAFLPFTCLLPDRVEVLAVQYPGRQDRRLEPFVDSVDALVTHVAGALGPWLDRPVALFGHSLGSLVAFETARRLAEQAPESRLAHLFVSGRVAPTVAHRTTAHLLSDDRLVAKLAELQGTDPRVLADEEVLRMALPAIRNDYRAAATYTWRPGAPLACPITVLTGSADPHVPTDGALAWHGLTTGETAFRSFPGGHFYLTEQAEAVCRTIRTATGLAVGRPHPSSSAAAPYDRESVHDV